MDMKGTQLEVVYKNLTRECNAQGEFLIGHQTGLMSIYQNGHGHDFIQEGLMCQGWRDFFFVDC